jgi:hypothetical protein
MLPGQLPELDEPLLSAVCTEHWPESQTLDFKDVLPGMDDRSRHEFLKDVSAFANASGGDLVYGIHELAGRADRLAPIAIGANPVDATKRRLSQILESGLEPRVEGVAMHAIQLANGDYVLVVRVPASFQRPHRYRMGGHTRWVVRADTHIVDLTYDQIRDAFDRTATLADRARRFRDERLSAVISGTTGRPMQAGPRCVVHLIPIASIAGKASADVRSLYNAYQVFMFDDWGGASRSLNLDGLVIHPGGPREVLAYTQVFRSGALEAARFGGALAREDARAGKAIPSGVVSGFIRDALLKFLEAAVRWNISGPAIASAALLNIGDYRFWYQPRNQFTRSNPSDRPNLILPEIWIDQLRGDADPDAVVRPLLDTLWQSFDLECCEFFDGQGRWVLH